jgi:hypothetical protein
MDGITFPIARQKNRHSFDVKDVLPFLGNAIFGSNWRCKWVECIGESAEELHRVSDEAKEVDGREFVELITHLQQTIDGRFIAYLKGQTIPWLVIDIIDSTYFDIWTEDKAILQDLSNQLRKVQVLPKEYAPREAVANVEVEQTVKKSRLARRPGKQFEKGATVKFGDLEDGDLFCDADGTVFSKFPASVLPYEKTTTAVNKQEPDRRYFFRDDQEVQFVDYADGPFPYYVFDTIR